MMIRNEKIHPERAATNFLLYFARVLMPNCKLVFVRSVLLAALLLVSYSASASDQTANSEQRASSATAMHVAAQLDKDIGLSEVNSSISDFANLLSDKGVPTLIDHRGLKIAGQTNELKLSGSISTLPLRTALRKLLEPHKLRAIVDNDGLLITASFEQLTLAGIGVSRAVVPNAHQELLRQLQKNVSISFSDTPLNEALRSLSKQADVNFVIDDLALEEIVLKPDVPVSCELKSVSLLSVLRLILRDLSLTYMLRDEVIQITTQEAAEMNEVNHIYFLESTGFLDHGDAIQTIETTISPDTWPLSSCSAQLHVGPYRRPAIMITATSDIHAQIGELFLALRAGETK